MTSHVTGVVLAGGASRRMGTDKSALEIAGATLLERAVHLLAPFCDEVLVVGGSSAPDDATLIPDPVPGAGPLNGLVAGFEANANHPVLLLAVDLPSVTEEMIESLLSPLGGDEAVRLAAAGERVQPLCGFYGSGLGDLASEQLASEDRSMQAFLGRVPDVTTLEVPEDALVNVNTPEEYEAAVRRLGRDRNTG